MKTHFRVYLNVVGEPVEVRICVFYSEEHVASRYDPALRDSFDPDRETAIMFLKQEHLLRVRHMRANASLSVNLSRQLKVCLSTSRTFLQLSSSNTACLKCIW